MKVWGCVVQTGKSEEFLGEFMKVWGCAVQTGPIQLMAAAITPPSSGNQAPLPSPLMLASPPWRPQPLKAAATSS